MQIHTDIRLSSHDRVDVYVPDGTASGAILLLHRGWFDGDKSDDRELALALCTEGFVVFAANYRLPPLTTLTSARFDALAALNWAVNSEFVFDRGRIAVWGSSVGGSLAVEVALEAGVPAVSWSAPIDLKDFIERTTVIGDRDYDHDFSLVTVEDAESMGTNEALMRILILQLVSNNVSWLASAEPLARVSPRSGPVMLVNSMDELVPKSGALAMEKALSDHGVLSTVTVLPGKSHGKGYASDAFSASVDFTRQAFETLACASADEKARQEQDDFLDEALLETFPGSDPISPGHVRHSLA